MMSVAYEVKPALRKLINNDEEAEAALIELINQILAAQRNGYDRLVESQSAGHPRLAQPAFRGCR